jgi:hypothetical protein
MPAVYRPVPRLSAALILAACILLAPAWAGEAADEVRMPVDLTVVPLDGAEPALTTEQPPAPAMPAAPAKAEKKAADKKPAAEKPQAAKPEPAKPEQAKAEPKPEPAKAEKKAEAKPAAEKALPAGMGQVRSVEISVKDGIFVLRVVTDRPVGDVQARLFKDPRRLAVDLMGSWRKHGEAVVRAAEGPVKTVRVGEHPDHLRLVLDFRNPGPGPELSPEIAKTPDGVTVAFPVTP